MKVVTITLKSKDKDCNFSEELETIADELFEGYESGFNSNSLNSYNYSVEYTNS